MGVAKAAVCRASSPTGGAITSPVGCFLFACYSRRVSQSKEVPRKRQLIEPWGPLEATPLDKLRFLCFTSDKEVEHGRNT